MKRKIVTGIDIGTSVIRIVVSEYLRGESAPRILSLTSKRSRGLRHGYIIDISEAKKSLREAIADAERTSNTKIEYAYISMGGISLESSLADGSVAISKADGETGDTDLRRAMEASEANLKKSINRHILQSISISYKLDGKRVIGRPIGMRGEILEVKSLFITCLEQHFEDLIHIVESAGIMIEDIIPSPIAESFVVLTRIQKTVGCILADIGAETVSIVVFEEGIPISLKVFSIGSMDITSDIALGLKISLDEAEELKIHKEGNNYSKKKLDEIITARLSDIFDLIETQLKKMGKNSLLPAGIIITGGGSNIEMIEHLAKHSLNIPAKIASIGITSVVQMPKSSESQIIKKNIDPSWAVAYGLCTASADKEPEEFSGTRFVRQTGSNLTKWLRQFLP
ncbi:MAG: cell division protein FtsA [Candidatus Vogelbacteria bacterium]|nr:cell division protein FtsA [Candidatus Vogelbacteria bacterium]